MLFFHVVSLGCFCYYLSIFNVVCFVFCCLCLSKHTCARVIRLCATNWRASWSLHHKLKSVVVTAPQAEERRGKCTWRTMKNGYIYIYTRTCMNMLKNAFVLLQHCSHNRSMLKSATGGTLCTRFLMRLFNFVIYVIY